MENISCCNKIVVPVRLIIYVGHFVKDGIIIDNPCDIVEHFDNYFVNIADDLACKIPTSSFSFSSYLDNPILNSFSFLPCGVHEVIHAYLKWI